MPAIEWNAAQLPSVVERLANGLTVIVHVEPKSPIAAVYVGYRAGSRDEPKSKAGLAHLCEHLMFSGTKSNPGSYFAPFEQAGALWMNAFVREDYSAYFATVPAAAVDFAMSMEADRMANIAEVLDDDRVERQRDIVVNELRQREAQAYGCAARLLAELAHPPGHPYAHLPDGMIAELRNISTDDVRVWIGSRHSPEMATLIVAGDVEPGRVIQKANHHFGLLASRPVAPRLAFTAAGSPVASRRQIELPVKHAKLCIAWNGPGLASPDYPALEAACEILAGTKSSRLGHRIVQAGQLASDIAVEVRPRELGVLVVLSITARIGAPLSTIEALVRGEIERLFTEGPAPHELDVARLRLFGKIVRGFERVGGPQSKSDVLGLATIAGGTPDSHQSRLSILAAMQPEAVAAASRWLADTGAVLEMRPIIEGKGA
ncbi:MAG: insulinase family protein [Deltaproteobacteria bacterium]|nr:insulinase family protein [Deltaproteobacteria bacterium]